MIDLRNKSLPSAINVGGRDFMIYTDFRKWLEFNELAKQQRPLSDYLYLFVDDYPIGLNFFPELVDFFANPNSTPNTNGGGRERIIDYIEDGEYIVASFMQAYGIDLTECDMHWHLFKALFVGLPDETKIKQIMSMRGYRKDNKSYEKKCMENKKAWELPLLSKAEKEEALKQANELFYNSLIPRRKKNGRR